MSELVRVFSDAKLVESRFLNVAGAQPLRGALARVIYHLRATPDDPIAAEVARHGYAVRSDFLPQHVFDALVRETEEFARSTLPRWLHQQGPTLVVNHALTGADATRFPQLGQWRDGAYTLALASAAERRPLRPGTGSPMLEEVIMGDTSVGDPQNALHIDAVFNTHKVWLYLDDVTEENGPLVYVPGSHRLDGTRLVEEYRDSTLRNRCVDPSRRIGDAEVARRGLERSAITCARNSLVVANTSGYHCRAPGQPGSRRRALQMSFRFNPFRYPAPRVVQRLRRAAGLARHGDN